MNTVPLISILAIEYFVLFYPPISHLIKHQYFSFGLMDHFLFVIKEGETYSFGYLPLEFISSEPRQEKTCLRGVRPGKTQTGLLS